MTTTRFFILDDMRDVYEAFDGARLDIADYAELSVTLVRTYREAMQIIESEPAFDMWILDNDLGFDSDEQQVMEGHAFLRECMERFPDKVPHDVTTCSANPVKAARIRQDFESWESNGRRSFRPLGSR